jgi:subtilisin family serine protease
LTDRACAGDTLVGVNRICLSFLAAFVTAAAQPDPANWGLKRIDRPDRLVAPDYAGQFRYDADGRGVNIYIIDSGVYTAHHEFTDRIHVVGDFVAHPGNPQATDDVSDCAADGVFQGHGTHNASYAAGSQYGVAKSAHIWVLKVDRNGPDGCAATTSEKRAGLLAAVKWVSANHRPPAVVNISFDASRFGAEVLQAIHRAATRPDPPGRPLLFTLSAGGGGNVATRFGDLADSAIVVAASDIADTARQTTYGPGLALFAPGVGTRSAACCAGGPDAFHDAVGECPRPAACDSYAAPVAAGVAAAFLQLHPSATPAQVKDGLRNRAAAGRITNPGSSPNLLLQMVRLTD